MTKVREPYSDILNKGEMQGKGPKGNGGSLGVTSKVTSHYYFF